MSSTDFLLIVLFKTVGEKSLLLDRHIKTCPEALGYLSLTRRVRSIRLWWPAFAAGIV